MRWLMDWLTNEQSYPPCQSPAPLELKQPRLHQPSDCQDIDLNMIFDITTPDDANKRHAHTPSKKMRLEHVGWVENIRVGWSKNTITFTFTFRAFSRCFYPKQLKIRTFVVRSATIYHYQYNKDVHITKCKYWQSSANLFPIYSSDS